METFTIELQSRQTTLSYTEQNTRITENVTTGSKYKNLTSAAAE
jgi:hypothetical protein